MPLTLDQATYHLGVEVNGKQPVISLHTDPANNDYPIQQVGIMGGLAALNAILLNANRA